MPIECGGIRANEGETRRTTVSLGGGESVSVELSGFKNGGYVIYTTKLWGIPTLTSGFKVDAGREEEILYTGVYVKGTENPAREQEMTWDEKQAIIEKNKNWRPR